MKYSSGYVQALFIKSLRSTALDEALQEVNSWETVLWVGSGNSELQEIHMGRLFGILWLLLLLFLSGNEAAETH